MNSAGSFPVASQLDFLICLAQELAASGVTERRCLGLLFYWRETGGLIGKERSLD